jgi:hypothetical protein
MHVKVGTMLNLELVTSEWVSTCGTSLRGARAPIVNSSSRIG